MIAVLYRALWDFAWETRILCALSCVIAFVGAIAVYGFLWSMKLWKNDNNDGYRYIGGNEYNHPVEQNNILKSQPKTKIRKLKKPFIPPPKYIDNKNNYENNNNNIDEMKEQYENEEEESQQ